MRSSTYAARILQRDRSSAVQCRTGIVEQEQGSQGRGSIWTELPQQDPPLTDMPAGKATIRATTTSEELVIQSRDQDLLNHLCPLHVRDISSSPSSSSSYTHPFRLQDIFNPHTFAANFLYPRASKLLTDLPDDPVRLRLVGRGSASVA
jgi:hypothetical protein